jgi:hypothetical protein
MTRKKLPDHFWKDLKSRREQDLLRYLDGFSDSSLRSWRKGIKDLPKEEVAELVRHIFNLRLVRRLRYIGPNSEYIEPETGEMKKLW